MLPITSISEKKMVAQMSFLAEADADADGALSLPGERSGKAGGWIGGLVGRLALGRAFGAARDEVADEEELAAVLERRRRRLQLLTSRKLARVYPKATRFDSANLDPLPCWRAGVQLVALNLQVVDLPTQLHHALFAASGYVLKPPALRAESAGQSAWPAARESAARVSITILSLHHLPTHKESRPRLHAGRRAATHSQEPKLSGAVAPPIPSDA